MANVAGLNPDESDNKLREVIEKKVGK